MNRRIVLVERGVLRIEQHIRVSGPVIGTDVSGPACIFAQVRVANGTIAYLRGETRITAPQSFAVFLPPFSIAQVSLTACAVSSAGLAFRPPASVELAEQAVLFGMRMDSPAATSVDDVLGRLRDAEDKVDVARAPDPAARPRRAKSILDANYGARLTIGHIAAKIRCSPASLSREFKGAFGLPPVRYRHHLRIMDALMRLADDARPADVCYEVGFDDLGRFYKTFRTVACAPPGSYRLSRSRNAKT